MNYVILAAGLGSRFIREGVTTPKPLVPLMGRPMIGRLIGVLRSLPACGTITIVANPRMQGLIPYLQDLRSQGAPLDIRPLVTDNSFTSLAHGAQGQTAPFIALTVDTVFPTAEFARFVERVSALPPGEVCMAMTRYIHDESPLYGRLSPDGDSIIDYRYGGTPFPEGPIVSAGIYGLTPEAIASATAGGTYPASLSDFQRILATGSTITVRPHELSIAVDVDCGDDRTCAERLATRINGERPPRRSLRAQYADSLKSLDTEEHIDLAFYRPIGFAWAILFRRLHISPNAVTIASIFIGVAAGICFYPTSIAINITGMLLLVWANTFDSADGQLARLTGSYSRLGRILDGLSGDFWFASIYIAICLRTIHTQPWFAAHPWAIWTLAATAGICHARQAAIADYYRQFHLFFLKGLSGSELDSSSQLTRHYATLSWTRQPLRKLIAGIYLSYTRGQEALTPAMQRLRRHIAACWPQGIPATFRTRFLRHSLPLCKWENFLTFNWRTIFLLLTLLTGAPWLYFIIELTLFNIIMLLLTHRHERLCRHLLPPVHP